MLAQNLSRRENVWAPSGLRWAMGNYIGWCKRLNWLTFSFNETLRSFAYPMRSDSCTPKNQKSFRFQEKQNSSSSRFRKRLFISFIKMLLLTDLFGSVLCGASCLCVMKQFGGNLRIVKRKCRQQSPMHLSSTKIVFLADCFENFVLWNLWKTLQEVSTMDLVRKFCIGC